MSFWGEIQKSKKEGIFKKYFVHTFLPFEVHYDARKTQEEIIEWWWSHSKVRRHSRRAAPGSLSSSHGHPSAELTSPRSSNKPSLNSLKWLGPWVQALIWCINLSPFLSISTTLLFQWFISYPQQLITLAPHHLQPFGSHLWIALAIFYFHFEIKLEAINF